MRLCFFCSGVLNMLKATNLKAEYKSNPIGMDERFPRFSYELLGDGSSQKMRRIVVQDENKKTVWDSGFVNDGSCHQIVYSGSALKPFTRYFWKVYVQDETGKTVCSTEKAFFETGFLGKKWTAQWILGKTGSSYKAPVQYFRRRFNIEKKVVKARLYATALGLYEAYINGKKVSPDLFTPGWTDYHNRVQYQAYDVTKLLKNGCNVIADLLAEGWFCGSIPRHHNLDKPAYGPFPLFMQELHLTYEDGTTEKLVTDEQYHSVNTFPALKLSDIYAGEIYDANEEPAGWLTSDSELPLELPAKIFEGDIKKDFFADCPEYHSGKLPAVVWNSGAPVREIMTIQPVSIKKRKHTNTFIVDFGQNITGRERFLLKKSYRGTTITIRHGEMLNEDGSLYTRNLRTARATTVYHAANSKKQVIYEPKFTYYGFRYLEISGWPGELNKDQIEAVVIHSDLPDTGDFECSNEMLNKLFRNIVWGQRGNFLDNPTDCPQRDERLGWTGDTQIFMNTATFNMYAPEFYTKWIHDLNSCKYPGKGYPHYIPHAYKMNRFAAGWADAAFICPDMMLKKYGDTRLIETYFDKMKDYFQVQLEKSGGNYIVNNAVFADWLNLDDPTSKELISTAYLAGMTKLMSHHAELIGRNGDAKELAELSKKVTAAYQKEFFVKNELKENSQTAALLTLHFELAPKAARQNVCNALLTNLKAHDNHLATGFLGTPLLLKVLTKIGQVDLAYEILQKTTYPGWLYPVTQGATTMWERWNSWNDQTGFGDVSMNSFNHYAYGAVAEWFYETICGINALSDNLEQAGFRQFLLAPEFGSGLEHATATYISQYGPIVSSWRRDEKFIFWAFCVPAGTTAIVKLPGQEKALKEAGIKKQKNGIFLAEPGEYLVEISTL